jgi:hypothetical protein
VDIFISWSGERSLAVARELEDWIPNVLQTVKIWLSAENIDAGLRWPIEITDHLGAINFGICCVTLENQEAPWLNFEAGAISKLTDGKVIPFLINLGKADLKWPLAQFQAQLSDLDGTKRMLRSINTELGEYARTEQQLETTLQHFWPDLETRLKEISSSELAPKVTRRPEDLLEELLDLVRGLTRQQAQSIPPVGPPRALAVSLFGKMIAQKQLQQLRAESGHNYPSVILGLLHNLATSENAAERRAFQQFVELAGYRSEAFDLHSYEPTDETPF